MADTASAVERVRGDGSDLPFEDETFDVAITVAALHHVADPADVRATLMEMVRVLRPGGRIVVWDHNPRNPYWKNLMARVPQDDGSERLVPEEEIVGGLEAGGGAVVGTSQLGLVPEFVPPSLIGLARAARIGGGAHAGPPAALRPQRDPRSPRLRGHEAARTPGAAPRSSRGTPLLGELVALGQASMNLSTTGHGGWKETTVIGPPLAAATARWATSTGSVRPSASVNGVVTARAR